MAYYHIVIKYVEFYFINYPYFAESVKFTMSCSGKWS